MKIERNVLNFHRVLIYMMQQIQHLRSLRRLLREFAVVAILGPRRIGGCRRTDAGPSPGPRAGGHRRASPRGARLRPAGRDAAALLDDARPLPRASVERERARQCLRSGAHDGPALPRPAGGDLHGAAAPALVREHHQAAGQGSQGLRPGQRPAARAAGLAHPARPGVAPQGRGLEGFGLEAEWSRGAAPGGVCYFWAVHTGAELDLLVVRDAAAWLRIQAHQALRPSPPR